ncbi:hypothetical protein ACFL96_14850 [Thermoproteota archaeon]
MARTNLARNSTKNAVRDLCRQCVIRGKENPYEAAVAIETVMGGVTKVVYDPNKTLKLHNHALDVGISPKGLNNRQMKRLEELVVIAHHLAEAGKEGFDENNVSNVNLGEREGVVLSTKHYKENYQRFQQQVLEKYV